MLEASRDNTKHLYQKWARVYRHGLLQVGIHTNNGLERQHEILKYNHLDGYKNCSLSEMVTVLHSSFFPNTYKKYVELNVTSSELVIVNITSRPDKDKEPETAAEMDVGNLYRLADSMHMVGRKTTNPMAATMASGIEGSSCPIICVIIQSERTRFYWRNLLTMLDASLFNNKIDDGLKEGLFVSFLVGASAKIESILSTAIKHRKVDIRQVTIPTVNGVLKAKDTMTQELTNIIEYDTIGNSKHFVDCGLPVSLEMECSETSYLTVLTHILLLASKAMTAADKSPANAKLRMQALSNTLPIEPPWMLTDDSARIITQYIKRYPLIRRVIVDMIIACGQPTSISSGLVRCISQAGTYLKMTGLTGFQMVCQFAIQAKSPVLAMSSCRAEVINFTKLLALYREIGKDGPYLKFLGNPNANSFNPQNFKMLYNFSVGFATMVVPTMKQYVPGVATTSHSYYTLGMDIAMKSIGAHKKAFNEQLGISQEDVDRFATIQKQTWSDEQRNDSLFMDEN